MNERPLVLFAKVIWTYRFNESTKQQVWPMSKFTHIVKIIVLGLKLLPYTITARIDPISKYVKMSFF
ncbi:MAG: hypothetical protein WAM42_09960 [Candidatus Nitrosopolaris sp.]